MIRQSRNDSFPLRPCRRAPWAAPLTIILLLAALSSAGCATAPGGARVVARDDRFLVVVPEPGATSRTLAAYFLGGETEYWIIEDANPTPDIQPGRGTIIPLRHWNPVGVRVDGYQTVPILAYHRIGPRPSAMTITADGFRRQMRYLRDNGYRVISLSAIADFLEGRRQLPERAVIITFDDGYSSVYDAAFPILREFGYPATLFVYTDYIDRGGVTRKQLREMSDSGLFTILPHSKTHENLAIRLPRESKAEYRRRLEEETAVPRRKLKKIVSGPIFAFSYPYGDANDEVLAMLEDQGYALGVTVQKGGNPAFAPHRLLRRTIVYGNRGMDHFISSLQVFKSTR